VRTFEYAGVAGIHIEDQVYPKRDSYHRGLEHVIDLEEFETKIQHALAAREDPDFIIIGRTDGFRAVEGSYEEGIRRCKALIKLGADAIFPFPWGTPPEEFVQKFRQDVPGEIPIMALAGLFKDKPPQGSIPWNTMGRQLGA
jgi:methylisocitrate lyase